MSDDVLSDVLDMVRLSGAHIFRIDIRGTWCVASNPTAEDFSSVLAPGDEHVIVFHVVVDGECWMQGRDGAWFAVHAGEAVVLPHGGVHRLGDRPHAEAVSIHHVFGSRKLTELSEIEFSTGDGAYVQLLCGFLGCDGRAFAPLFASLPAVLRVRLGPHERALVDHALREIAEDAPGTQSVRIRLTEVLFMQALRRYVDQLPQDARGWLAAVRDPVVGRALHVMHHKPCFNWSVQSLADAAASSRSHLATRFREVLGQPPMHYLTGLRMQIAARKLRQSGCTVAGVADDVGYASPAAFQRAFKRHFGVGPGGWREHRRQ